ncbi:LytTR family DNA-binding domain-containing protein [Chitinophaga sp. 212800010-3]|uniref:LytR/AlgR family response regulator transcription factor n=1 Tax=unclassified Chitinophaga TaxID=2619133 RepID=UPI002DF1EA3B|nr:Response regulator receiver [Chitinophaga sp. 212800010-3]
MLKAIAIDDEPIALEVIENMAGNVGFLDLTAVFLNPVKAVDFLTKNNVDLIFLDIKMPNISGIELIRSLSTPPMVIFTTAYSEHAVQSFELNAIDYLLKPFSLSRFLQACNKAFEQNIFRKSNFLSAPSVSSVFIKSGYEQIRVVLGEILYAESNGIYINFILEQGKVISRMTMAEVVALLPASDFARIHRSYIVAIRKVTRIDRNNVWIQQVELPIGSNYVAAIEKIITG